MNIHQRHAVISRAVRCESLERRMLLSLAPAGLEFRVNTFTTGAQDTPAVASDADGDFVVVWSGNGSGDGNGVFAQRYNAAGVAQGAEFLVNSSTTFSQSDPSVAMDADGDFVIAWENRMSATASDYDIFARRYNAAGVPQGGELHVNTFTTANQVDPAAAMDPSGDFVIVWTSESDFGIHAQRFDSAGATVGSEFNVHSATTNSGVRASVAMDASGDFVVIWNGGDIWARRFDSAGVAQGLPFPAITFTTGFSIFSSVAMDADGDFLVTGEKDGPDGSSYGVFGQSFNAAGVPQGGEFLVNTFTTNRQRIPAVTMDADGDAVVVWNSLFQDSTNSYGVYAQRYDESNPDTAAPMVGGLFLNGEPITPGQQFGETDTSLVLSFSEDMSVAGGATGANSATNRANYRLLQNGVDITLSTIFTVGFGFSSGRYRATLNFPPGSLPDGSYSVTARDTLRDISGNALDGNLDGVAGGDFSRAFSVALMVPAGSDFRANATTSLDQHLPAVARVDNGNFVVVWESEGQDGSFDGIYGRRYNAAGVAQGGEFRVNSITTNFQRNPAVAMDADGDFVVTWGDAFGAGDTDGIFAKRYNSNGAAQGSEFRVNTLTTGRQWLPDVAMDDAGNFVITWESVFDPGIYAQLYNAAGVPQGGEILVRGIDTITPAVAMDSDGDFVIAWEQRLSPENDRIFAKRYNAAGGALDVSFAVSNITTNDASIPDVAMDSDGNFVVTWWDGFFSFAQRFNATGMAQGAQLQINGSGFGDAPAIAMDGDGDFVVVFENPYQPNGASIDVYARRYNEVGVALGAQFLVNTFTPGDQENPAVAMDADGDFVIAWQSDAQDGSGFGIYAQRFARPTEVNISSFLFQTASQQLHFTFNHNVSASLTTADLLLENLSTSQLIPSTDVALSYDTATNLATFTYTGNASGIAGVLADGNYRATLLAAGITNPGGTPLSQNHIFNFFFMNGDADRDADVDLDDFNIIATNFNTSGKTFSQGNFSYDAAGNVNLDDFNILATRFGTALPSSGAAPQHSARRDRLVQSLGELLA